MQGSSEPRRTRVDDGADGREATEKGGPPARANYRHLGTLSESGVPCGRGFQLASASSSRVLLVEIRLGSGHGIKMRILHGDWVGGFSYEHVLHFRNCLPS